MKAYRFITPTRIEPFGDQVSECQLGVTQLGEAVTNELHQAGVEPTIGTPEKIRNESLVLPDTMFVTATTIRRFLQACPPGSGIFRLALKKGPLTQWLCPLANVETDDNCVMFPCYIVRKKPAAAASWEQIHHELSTSAQPVILDPESKVKRIPVHVPAGRGHPSEMLLPRTKLVAADISHWVHLLWLNQLVAWLTLEAHGKNKTAGGYITGTHCDIHPTALVENSILGDNVTIGPFASVIDCAIGDGVELAENSRLKRCCVGHRCRTLPDSYFIGCTFYPGSTLANFMLRESMVGSGCFITSGLVFSTVGPVGPIHVNTHGKQVNTGRWMLGSAVGHGCTLGTLGLRGNIAPGMEIPNGYMIVMKPEDGLQRPPTDPRPMQPFMNLLGTAKPVGASMNGSRS